MPGNFSKTQTVITGDTITASLWNGEFDNIIANFEPSKMDDTSSNVTAMQTVEDPYPGSSESLATTLEGEIRRLRYQIKAITGQAQWYIDPSVSLATASVPVGSIIPHYDFNAAVSIPSNYLYCNGQTVSDGDSPIDGKTLPDLSGRYLVGFGTVGGGTDIHNATWTAANTGNASHQINIQHNHTLSGSTGSATTGISATHTHTHSDGTLKAQLGIDSSDRITVYQGSGQAFTGDYLIATGGIGNSSGVSNSSKLLQVDVNGNTGAASTSTVAITDGGHTHSVGTLDDTNELSAAQNIQPESIRVRFIMRYK